MSREMTGKNKVDRDDGKKIIAVFFSFAEILIFFSYSRNFHFPCTFFFGIENYFSFESIFAETG